MAAWNSYAILLRDAGSPNADAIRRAFRVFRHLTDADAIRLAANAQGILMRHLRVDEAKAFHHALTQEGVNVALVKEEALHFLPASQRVQRLEFTPETLSVFDHLGQGTPLAWSEITLLAAGAVPHLEIGSPQAQPAAMERPAGLWPRRSGGPHQLKTGRLFILELVNAEGTKRFEIQAHEFHFVPLIPAAPTDSLMEKFVRLTRALVQRAPGAQLNRGALDIREGVDLVRGYPSHQAMLDEIVWLWWNAKQTTH
ncbi:MAG: hypothetical protein M9920_03525 [Verrucomicrobiae bacterium]|nr:hypothetical protein [Verrucomicrobiae bacterium]